MKNTKTQKGITLIALIITIIVLLILAVVSISAVTESDIIKHADNAVTKHDEGKAKEDAELAKFENFLDEYANKGNIKYYIFNMGDTVKMIQKVDFNAGICTTINLEDNNYSIESISKILSTASVTEEVVINLSEGTAIIEVGSLKGTFENNGITIENGAYLQNDKMYAKYLYEDYYAEFTQITDAEQIADIEEGIANAQ